METSVKDIRKKSKLSQSQFSQKFGIPLRTLQKWEQNEANPSPYLLSFIQNKIELENYIDVSKYMFIPQNNFKSVIKNTFKNIKRVHPIQQQRVYDIIEELKKYDEVKKIIVFGSSVTYKCNYDSDIDIYVELTSERNVKTYSVDCPVDFWTNYTVDLSIKNEIKNKGVLVYDC